MFWLFRVALSAVNHAQTSRRRRPLSEHCAPINLDAAQNRPPPPDIYSGVNGLVFEFHATFAICRFVEYLHVQDSAVITIRVKFEEIVQGGAISRIARCDFESILLLLFLLRDPGKRYRGEGSREIQRASVFPGNTRCTRINHGPQLQICSGVFLFHQIAI